MVLDNNRKLFLANTRLESVDNVSSEFRRTVKDVTPNADNQGNLSVDASMNPEATTDVDGYTITIDKAGRTDGRLLSVEQQEIELGIGQLKDIQEVTFKGEYDPPRYLINDGTYRYGTQANMGKFVFGNYNAGTAIDQLFLCDRNDESYFIFFVDNGSSLTRCTTAPKQHRTDSNPLVRVTCAFGSQNIVIIGATRIKEDRYLLVGVNTALKTLEFMVVNDSGVGVVYYEQHIAELDGDNGNLYNEGDVWSDMKGNVYLVLGGSLVDTTIPGVTSNYQTPLFFKSNDFGRTWSPVLTPGTNTFASIGNPYEEEYGASYDPTASGGYGYRLPTLYYDDINEEFLLTAYGRTSTSVGKLFIVKSKDFTNWTTYIVPSFRSHGSTDFSNQLIKGMTTRYGNALISFAGGYLFSSPYKLDFEMSVFENDSQKYGTRYGYLWMGASGTTINKGAAVSFYDVDKFDGVVYVAANFMFESATTPTVRPGFCVHAIGIHTNLVEETPYSNGYFGNIQDPTEVGWTLTSGGTHSGTVTDDGYRVTTTSGQRYYTRTDVVNNLLGGGAYVFKSRFCYKPVSGSQQEARFFLPSITSPYHCNVSIFIGPTGWYAWDFVAGAALVSVTMSITEDIQFYVVWYGDGLTSGTMAIYYSYDDVNNNDKWIGSAYTVLTTNTITFNYARFGTQGANLTSDGYWKFFYFTDVPGYTDYTHLITDGNESPYDSFPKAIPIQKEYQDEQTIDGIILNWQGLDGYYGDEFTLAVEGEFPKNDIVSKFPSRVWRSGYGSAASGGAADVTIELNSSNAMAGNSMGLFVYDTYLLYGINFKKFSIDYKQFDASSWTPLASVDTTIDAGQIYIPAYRENEDTFDFEIDGLAQAYKAGELNGRYIMFERITMPNSTYGTQTFRNVAFVILDNSKSYGINNNTRISISTKGLLDPYAGSGTSSPMQLNANDDCLIYDTNYVGLLDLALQLHKYIRITIPLPASFATAWASTNQPNLPNEASWKISCFDVGTKTEVTIDADSGQSTNWESGFTTAMDEYGRIDIAQISKKPRRSFSLNYNLLDDDDYARLLALVKDVHDNGYRPFWFAPDAVDRPTEVYLVNIKGITSKRILPEHQAESLELEEVL